jgi:hypothetical protein
LCRREKFKMQTLSVPIRAIRGSKRRTTDCTDGHGWDALRAFYPAFSPIHVALAFLLAVLVSDVADAQLQMRGLRVRVPLDNAFLDRQIKIYTDPILERHLPAEIQFIKLVCDLSDEEGPVVEAAGREAVNQLAEQIRSAMRDKGVYVVEIDGRQVMLPAGFDEKLVTAPQDTVRREVTRAIQVKLPGAWKKLAADELRRGTRRTRAAIALQVAALDRAIWFSAKQRQELCDRLGSVDGWWQPTNTRPASDPAFDQLQLVLTGEELYRFTVPESEMAKRLTAAQRSIFRELAVFRQQEIVIAQPARRRVPRAAIDRQAQAEQQAQRELAVAQIEARVQTQVVRRALPAEDLQRRLAEHLQMRIDFIDAACSLSAVQRDKLLLAGKLDIQRSDEQSPHEQKQAPAELGMRIQRLRITGSAVPLQVAIFSEAQSYFRKSLAGRLSDEQKERLAAAHRERRAFERQAIVAAAVVGFERAALMTAEQCDSFAAALDDALANSDESDIADDRLFAALRIGGISDNELRPFFSDFQWPLAVGQQARLSAAAKELAAQQKPTAPRAAAVDGIFWQVE